jgi:hypothetical protein
MDITNYSVLLKQTKTLGYELLNECYTNLDFYYVTDLDKMILNSINSRSLFVATLQCITRLRFYDLQFFINLDFFDGKRIAILTKKNKYPVSFRLKNPLMSIENKNEVISFLLKNLNYEIYKSDLKKAIERLNLSQWFEGKNVTHVFRKVYASYAHLNNLSEKQIAMTLQQFDSNSQKAYIEPEVLNNFLLTKF